MAAERAVVDESARIMRAFAARTGLDGDGDPGRRYLWTDAHAVCNFLSLSRATGEQSYRDIAERLVHGVHTELGRHREDDARRGWISGLDEEAGSRHPTAGGLRIGKKLGERPRDAVYDASGEWDRDGQYFHYLTKWMHALSRVAAQTGNRDYLRWAIELAIAAYDGFLVRDRVSGRAILAWKMRIDLSEPLVPSAGLHDPLDGYVTCRELEFRSRSLDDGSDLTALREPVAGLETMLASNYPATDDPLGIGGLLFDAVRLAQLAETGQARHGRLIDSLIGSAVTGLDAFAARGSLQLPAARRLAFRELGLSIGLHGSTMIETLVARGVAQTPVSAERLAGLERHALLRDRIERFWADPSNQDASTWREHLDINAVMLATSMLPDQFLQI
jgi:hypothetical protein